MCGFVQADGMQLWVNLGCSPDKLVMGMPFYGRSFTVINNQSHSINSPVKPGSVGGEPGTYTREAGFLAYYEICMNLQCEKNAWTEMWDSVGLCPYMYKGIFFTYVLYIYG